MNSCRHSRRTYLLASGFMLLTTATTLAQTQNWPQWGGPSRNFKSDSKGLANSWPAAGPRRFWSRELGDGYSSIVAEGNKLYTMHRHGEKEIVSALDATTGRTVWEYSYDAPFLKDMDMGNGVGPHSTPLIAGNQIYAVGVTSKLQALDKGTGKLIWSHDLWKEFNGTFIDTGYSCSPVAYKDTVIVTVGGTGRAVMAFNQKDGTVAWSKQDFVNSPSSPIIARVAGQDQLVVFMAPGVAGLDPNNGDLLWSYPHETKWQLNISTPVWSEDGLLFLSSAYGVGSRVLELTRSGNKTNVKELWFSNRFRVHKDNAVRVGNHIYASNGDFGPAFFTAVDARTGNVVWQERGLSKASFLYADGKFIILDEDGQLVLATPSASGLTIHSKVQLLTRNAWTVPTLVGSRLYIRDQKTIMALDLS